MIRRLAAIGVAVALVGGLAPTAGATAGAHPAQTRRLLVHPPPGTPAAALTALGVAHPNVLGWWVVEIDGDRDPATAAAALAADTGWEVFPDTVYHLFDGSAEPRFGEQWALENTGQTGGTPGSDIHVRDAWTVTDGEASVVVAVIDAGADTGHPELVSRFWTNPGEIAGNGVDDDANGYVDDVHGWDFAGNDPDTQPVVNEHGTEVSGVVAAAVNGVGIAGVAPGATLMELRACTAGGCALSDVAEAVVYAVDEGARIINLSLGVTCDETDPTQAATCPDPLLAAAIDYAEGAGVLVVAAAGNGGENLDDPTTRVYPAGLPNANVVSVASSDDDDVLSSFSAFGATSVDLAAPGEAILTTAFLLGDYDVVSGTSFAAPHVAGAAALMLSRNPDLDPATIVSMLVDTVDRNPTLNGVTLSGGRLDAAEAVRVARFADVHGSTFEDDILWLADQGITKGCNPPTNTLYCPTGQVTRGQMAAFLVRALGLPPATSDHFDDDDGTTFEDDINRLAEAGITKGCNPPDNTLYCPSDPVTRGQMAAFLVRAYGFPPAGPAGFTDTVDTTFEADIDRLAAAGVTKGCNPPDNTLYCPSDPVTRGQMAAFLHRAGT